MAVPETLSLVLFLCVQLVVLSLAASREPIGVGQTTTIIDCSDRVALVFR